MDEGRPCYLHPESSARFTCDACGRPLCEACAVKLNGGAYCAPCVRAALERAREDAAVVGNARPAGLVFLFSLWPGAGHMYMGLMRRGTHLMALFLGSIWISSISGISGGLGFADLWGIVVAPVVWFYSFFDSLRISGRLHRGRPVYDRGVFDGEGIPGRKALGWGLIGLGALLLLGSWLYLLPPAVGLLIRRTLPPVILIAVGLAILWYEAGAWRR